VLLSEDDRQRIIEEELLRDQVKKDIEHKEAKGCCGCLVAVVVVVIVGKIALVLIAQTF
jgi:hypothetical protein